MREKLVIHHPCSQLVPFIDSFAVDRNTPLNHLILARFKVFDDFLGDLCQIPPVNEVVSLQKYSSQTRLPDRVVFEIELVESVERIRVGLQCLESAQVYSASMVYLLTHVHVKSINAQIISSEIDTSKDFGQCEVLSIPIQNHLVGIFLHLALNKS